MKTPITSYVEVIITDWLPVGPKRSPSPGELWTFEIDGKVESVTFLCPCGCGSECYTPVRSPSEPRNEREWEFSRGPNGVTLTPSIRYTGGCKAHFNLTNGKAVMHGDSGK